MRNVRTNRSFLLGLSILIVLIFTAVFANFIAPYDPAEKELGNRLLSPCLEHPFGTDQLGRDIFSRVIFGTRVSLGIGIVVIGISLIAGLALGLVAGYYGGGIDELIMRIVDGFLAFPSMFLALGFSAFLGQGIINLITALTLVEWTGFARVTRGSTLAIKGSEFVNAPRWLGAGDGYILKNHILPNILSPVIVIATLGIGNVILAAAGLSFLGLGVQPSIPEWGSMLNEGRMFLGKAPQIMFFPGLMIMITVLAFNFLGDGIRDLMDERMSRSDINNEV